MKYREGYKYQLAEDEGFPGTTIVPETNVDTHFIRLSTSGDLWIRAGYAWDGASGPTVDTSSAMRGALAHDAFYQLMREGHLDTAWRPAVDLYADFIWRQDGMGWLRRKMWNIALTVFAASAADPTSKKPILEAP